MTDADGGMHVTAEQLARLGNGDARAGRRELRLMLSTDRKSPTFSGPTEKPATVRAATEADETAVLDLLLLDLRENAEKIAPTDREKVMANIQVGTRRRGGVVGVINDSTGKIVAVTILHPVQWWWSNAWHFFEVVNFVHPDHRQSRHIDDLISFGRWWVDAMTKTFGYRVHLVCGVMGILRVRAKIALYTRKFGQQVGAAFVYPSPFQGD